MTTTFVLHGGETSRDHPENDRFFQRFTEFVQKESIEILMCYFAKEESIWEQRLEADRARITRQTSKDIALSLAHDADDLLVKIPSHDVLYIAGGHPEPLESYLPQLQGLGSLIQGKVYLGCSMGAFVVSENYVLTFDEQEPPQVHRGLGLLPVNTLCHWDVEPRQDLKVDLLVRAATGQAILTLDECKSAVFIR